MGRDKKQRDVLSEKGQKTESCGEWEGRANERDVVSGKGEKNREM